VICRLEIAPAAQRSVERLPGNVRQRVRRAIGNLAHDPRPPRSGPLEFELSVGEPRRLRLGRWRVVYAVIETDPPVVAVVAVRQRPPYQYEDLEEIFRPPT